MPREHVIVAAIIALLLTFVAHFRARSKPQVETVGRARFRILGALAGLGAITGFFLLMISGFYDLGFHSRHMTGYALVTHVTAGGIFAVCGILYTILRAEPTGLTPDSAGTPRIIRILFWMLMLATIVLLLTAALPMLPVFGTFGQYAIVKVHRYAALVAVASALPVCWGQFVRRWRTPSAPRVHKFDPSEQLPRRKRS